MARLDRIASVDVADISAAEVAVHLAEVAAVDDDDVVAAGAGADATVAAAAGAVDAVALAN